MRITKPPSFTKEELRQLYYGENLSQRGIGARLGVSRKAIRWWMHRWNIPCRSIKDSINAGPKNKFWQGGRSCDRGYISVWISSDSPFFSMAKRTSPDTGYIFEHRLVMAQHLDRCLQSWEVVHHKDGIRDHNDISNLRLTTNNDHLDEHSRGYQDGYRQGYQDGQSAKIGEFTKQIKLLQWQIKELKLRANNWSE